MSRLADIAYKAIPKPRALSPNTGQQRDTHHCLVVTCKDSPTFSYYLEERITRSPFPATVRHLNAPLDDIDPNGLFVIISRYIWPWQLQWLFKNRNRIAGAAMFIDDDLAATFLMPDRELSYKAYIAAIGILPLLVLNHILTDVWVSTPALKQVLGGSVKNHIKVVGPLPSSQTYESRTYAKDSKDPVVMAFHAGRYHGTEHAFLVPVVREALKRCGNLRFEVSATGKAKTLWQAANLPQGQFAIHNNLSWCEYLEDTKHSHIDILLVPLLGNSVNNVRAGTKRIDAVRMGAVAIMSRCRAFQHCASKGEIILEDDQEAWIEAICKLVEDTRLRTNARNATANVINWIAANEPHAFPVSSK